MVMESSGSKAPPTVGTKTKVAEAFCLPAKRSDSGIVNEVNDTRSPILPVAHVSEPSVSGLLDVATDMPVALLALAGPVIKPVKVTVTDTNANICPVPDVVITNDVDDGAAAVPLTFKELMTTPGAGLPSAKKENGKKRVIFPPDDTEPSPLGRNENVAVPPAY